MLVGFSLVARLAEGLEVVTTFPPTRGFGDYVVYLNLAAASAAEAAVPIEATDLLVFAHGVAHSSEHRGRHQFHSQLAEAGTALARPFLLPGFLLLGLPVGEGGHGVVVVPGTAPLLDDRA